MNAPHNTPTSIDVAASSRDRLPVGRLLLSALLIILFFFAGLGTWAALAPLESAALAPAKVTVAGNRRTVQHLEGGIVSKIRVKEGARVEPGELLLMLDETQARATLEQLRGRRYNLLAREARLLAERAGSTAEIRFPDVLVELSHEERVANAVAGERAIYRARIDYVAGRERILNQRVLQLREEIQGLRAQVDAETIQLELIRDEKAAIQTLFDQGQIDKPRLLASKRAEAGLVGSRGEHRALISQAEQRIGESELEIIDLQNRLFNEVVADLKETQAELTDLSQRLKAAEDLLARTEIRAPVGGTVVALQVHTVGGVITPGQKILDIVPEEDRLELEARVDPTDIDVVHAGLSAQVVLTAYEQRTTPTLAGTVSRVSADSFSDENSGHTYFLARVTVEPAELERAKGIDLYPGMPADVMIRTGSQTALDYLLRPLLQSLNRAFRES
jgi:HlyD family type I secretion membrane fusion protein